MGVLSPIVEPFVLSMLHAGQQLLFGRAIACQLIRDQHTWHILTALEQLAKELLGSLFVTSALNQDIKHVAMLIDSSPQRVQFAVDFEKDLIKMPFVAGSCTSPA